MKNILKIVLLTVILAGCTPEPDLTLNSPAYSDKGRFTISRVSVFQDELAYNQKRGIYLITDNKTGKEFVGVSGVGISEVGNVGKSTSDSR